MENVVYVFTNNVCLCLGVPVYRYAGVHVLHLSGGVRRSVQSGKYHYTLYKSPIPLHWKDYTLFKKENILIWVSQSVNLVIETIFNFLKLCYKLCFLLLMVFIQRTIDNYFDIRDVFSNIDYLFPKSTQFMYFRQICIVFLIDYYTHHCTEHWALRHKLRSCTVPFLYRSDLVTFRRMLYRPDVCNCTMPYIHRTVLAYAVRDPAQIAEVVALTLVRPP